MADLIEPCPYSPYNALVTSTHNCFLCGRDLKGCRSVEHVFPRWLLRRFELWNERLTLLNQTTIPYRYLTIPCCQECNTNHMSKLEEELKYAVEHSIDGLLSLEEIRLFQWTAKLLYGILFKESSLLVDRKDKSKGNIIPQDMLSVLQTLHGFMQSMRTPFKFESNAWSIFRVKTHSYGDGRDFDFRDNPLLLSLSIRMGTVGIIASLQDNGVIKAFWDEYKTGLEDITLHPLQFAELAAIISYSTYLINRMPKYVTVTPDDASSTTFVIPMPLQGFSSKPIFNDWNAREFSKCLAAHWCNFPGLTEDAIFQEPDKVISFLHNSDGTFRSLEPGFSFD